MVACALVLTSFLVSHMASETAGMSSGTRYPIWTGQVLQRVLLMTLRSVTFSVHCEAVPEASG